MSEMWWFVSLKVTVNSNNQYKTYEFLLAFCSNYVSILHRFEIKKYWSKIADLNIPISIWCTCK